MDVSRYIRDLGKFVRRLRRLGINRLDLRTFLKLVRRADINVVVDVRRNSFYKSKQGFSPKVLRKALKRMGVEYLYLKSLGNPKTGTTLPENEAKAFYQQFIREERQDQLKALFYKIAHARDSKQKSFCFICYCEYPKPCHTYWLIETLVNMKRSEIRGYERMEGHFELLPENYPGFDVYSKSNIKYIEG